MKFWTIGGHFTIILSFGLLTVIYYPPMIIYPNSQTWPKITKSLLFPIGFIGLH